MCQKPNDRMKEWIPDQAAPKLDDMSIYCL